MKVIQYPTKVLEAYRKMHLEAQSGREVEATVLTKAALALKKWKEQWQDQGREAGLRDALVYTQRVWSILQAELANPDNPLPQKLRENILNLSLFMDRRIFDIMAYPSPEKLSSLIEINLAIASGLRANPSSGRRSGENTAVE